MTGAPTRRVITVSAQEGFKSAEFLSAFAAAEIGDLKTLLEGFLKDNPGTVVEEFNPKTRKFEVKIKTVPAPDRARGIASNIVKNLRDALDQVVNAATQHVVGKSKRNAHFPFGNSPGDFDIAVTKNQCRDIPHQLHDILKSYEPYPTGEGYPGGNDVLRMLGQISGSHKHRTTLVVTLQPANISIGRGTLNTGAKGGELGAFLGMPPPTNNELVVITYGEGGYCDLEVEFSVYVAFCHPQLRDMPALDFLSACHQAVSHIVYDLQAEALKINPRS